MNPILERYVKDFSNDFGFVDEGEPETFEKFINYCTIDRFCPTKFGVEDITTGGGEIGIDGAAIVIGDYIVQSEDEAREEFEKRTRNTSVNYVFNQAKTGKSFKVRDMRNFTCLLKI